MISGPENRALRTDRGRRALRARRRRADRALPAAQAPVAAERETPLVPRPAIWLLADEDTRIYLFGTIHMLPPGLQWRTPAFENVVREADELVMEVAEDPAPRRRSRPSPPRHEGRAVSILGRVSPDRGGGLRELIEAVDITVESFDGMQTWAAAMTLAVAGLTQALAGPKKARRRT